MTASPPPPEDAAKYFGPPKAKKLKPSGVIPGRPHKNALLAQQQQQLFALRNSRVRIPLFSSYHCAAHTLIGKACYCTHTFDVARVREENCKKRNRTRERGSESAWQVREKVLCAHSRENSRVGESDRECARFFDNNHTHWVALYIGRRLSIGIALSIWHVCLSVWVCANCAKFPPDSSVEREGEKTQHLRGEGRWGKTVECASAYSTHFCWCSCRRRRPTPPPSVVAIRKSKRIGVGQETEIYLKWDCTEGTCVCVCVYVHRRRRRLRVGTRVAPSSARFALLSALFA